MRPTRVIVVVVLCAVCALAVDNAPADRAPLRPLVAAAVARDLGIASAGGVAGVKLEVLAPFTSLPSSAAVRVVSVKRGLERGIWLLRLECASLRDCLPFHVVLHSSQWDGAAAIAKPAMARVGGAGNVAGLATLARRGDRVELVEELAGMRLRTTARCLGSGALGERVLVETGADHRPLLATVVGRDTVRVEP